VAALEGHGDNAAPSVFGGLQVIAGDRAFRVERSLPGRLLFWVPDLETATDQSRSGLPATVSRSDAVFNLGRMGLLMAAVYEQRLDLLRLATQDRLHQPERLAQCDPAARAYASALEAGAAAAWLSGSGPTIAVVVDEADRIAVEKVLSETGSVLALDADHSGAVRDDG
jgi:homoserine kinase